MCPWIVLPSRQPWQTQKPIPFFANREFIHRLCISPGQKHKFTMLFDSHLTRCPYLCFSYGCCMLAPRYIWHYGKTANSEKPIRQQLPPLDANREKSLRTFTSWRRCIRTSTTWRNYHLKDFLSEPNILLIIFLHLLHHLKFQPFNVFLISALMVVPHNEN